VRLSHGQSVSPDGQRLAVSTPHAVLIYNLATLKVIGRIPVKGQFDLSKPEWSADGQRLVVVESGGTQSPATELVLFDLTDYRESARVRLTQERILGFSPEMMFVGSLAEGKLILRDGSTLAPIVELPGEFTTSSPAAFSPDGRFLAVGQETKLQLWDLKRREEVTVFDIHKGVVSNLVFTPNGRKLRCVTSEGACEIDLHTFDQYVAGNFAWNTERLIPELYRTRGRSEVERLLERMKTENAAAYQRGRAALDAIAKP